MVLLLGERLVETLKVRDRVRVGETVVTLEKTGEEEGVVEYDTAFGVAVGTC